MFGFFGRKGITGSNRPVAKIDKKTGKTIEIYGSVTEASKRTGISNGNISSAANGHRDTAGGFKWKFV